MRAVGLRTRVTAVCALGALAVSVALAGATYELVRTSLLDERERAAVRAATLDGSLVRQGLAGDEPDIALVLRSLDTGEARRPLRGPRAGPLRPPARSRREPASGGGG